MDNELPKWAQGETAKEGAIRQYLQGQQAQQVQQQAPATEQPNMTEKERATLQYIQQQQKPQQPVESVDPDEQNILDHGQRNMDYYASIMRDNAFETDEQRKKRIKDEKTQAIMDGVGNFATGMANAIGGIGGGYAFPGWEKDTSKITDPIEKAKAERLERAKRYYDAQHGYINSMENMNKRLRDLRLAKAQAARQKELNDARIAELNARSEAERNKSNESKEKKESNTTTTRKSGGGGRSGKENAPYATDGSSSPLVNWGAKKNPQQGEE